MSRRKRVNLAAAMAAVTVFGLTTGLMFPLLSIVMETRGLPPDMIGYNTAMQPVGILLAGFVIPRIVRAFGPKAAISGAAFAGAAIVLLYPVTPIYWAWFILRLVQGACVSTLFAVSEAMIVRYAEGPWRSRILALYATVLAVSFGGGPLIITVTGTATALPFIVGAIVLLLATVPLLFLKEDAAAESPEGAASAFAFMPKAPVLVLAIGVFGVVDAANLGFLPVYGLKKGLDENGAAWLLTAFVYGNVLFQLPIGWLADHLPKRAVMAGCAAVTVLAAAALPFAFGTMAMWALLLILGASSAGIYTVALAELGDRFKGLDVVAGAAAFSTSWGFGALLGGVFSGWSFRGYGPDGFFAMQALVFAAFLAALAARARGRR